jgi:hypothetical protein
MDPTLLATRMPTLRTDTEEPRMSRWRVDLELQPDNTVHVWPDGPDHVDHDLDGAGCICGPTLEEQSNGNVLVVHHSLDGRELTERRR